MTMNGAKRFAVTTVVLTALIAIAFPVDARAVFGETKWDGNLDILLSPNTVTRGEQLTVSVHLEPLNQAFDAWGVIILPDGTMYSMSLSEALNQGAVPIVNSIPALPLGGDFTLLNMPVPTEAPTGEYTVAVGLFPPGVAPSSLADAPSVAIEGYFDQETLTVQ